MVTKPKQIVIDKSAFQATTVNMLCGFAERHLLLICDTLLYECGTADGKDAEHLLQKCKCLIDAGGYYCHCSLRYVRWEAEHRIPYTWFLPDLLMTEQIRIGRVDLAGRLKDETGTKTFSSRCEIARKQLLESSEWFKKRLDIDSADLIKAVRQLTPSEKCERLREAFGSIDRCDQRKMALRLTPNNWIRDETRFCLSTEWMTWQYMRLITSLVYEYSYLRVTGGAPSERYTEHDYQDMEYVLLLSRADAIITCDKKLVEPLARAAFPEKDVFSSLEEVPASYRCDWADS